MGSLISFPEGNKKEIEGKKMPGKINFFKQPAQLIIDFPIHAALYLKFMQLIHYTYGMQQG